MRFIDHAEVARRLSYPRAIELVRDAMMALSRGDTLQLPRAIMALSEQRLFGIMSGALGARAVFGTKLISVFRENAAKGAPSHQGVIVIFDPDSGAPLGVVDAGEVTAIRTAAASAVATDCLARRDATRLVIAGTGEQALTHAKAIDCVRPLSSIAVWGRNATRAAELALQMETALQVAAAPVDDLEVAARDADIICTVTAAIEPILFGAWIKPGAHVNIIGSSHAGPSEVDSDLVARSRYIADSRANVLQQGAEFLHAKAAGVVGDDHIVAEIGEVLLGRVTGRRADAEITAYKSLGHVVQDIACAAAVVGAAVADDLRA